MNRRRALAAIGSLVAGLPVSGWAQTAPAIRIAWLAMGQRASFDKFFVAFYEGLKALGYVQGRGLTLDDRWGDTMEATERLAAELVALKPAVIVTAGPAVRAVTKTASTVPVVFGFSGNPIDAGLSTDYVRPDRNMTGMSFMALELVGKRIEILKEIVPGMRRLAVLSNQQHTGEPREFLTTREAAERLRLTISYHPFKGAADIDKGLASALAAHADAGVVFPDATMMARSADFARFSLQHHIPMISGWAAFADGGNLASYGPDLHASWRRLAYFVDRMVKGAKPAELPIELPTTVEMVLNMNTAKALGIKVPQTALLRANRVISD
jgi:putative ABC transport system substrate-binding protein